MGNGFTLPWWRETQNIHEFEGVSLKRLGKKERKEIRQHPKQAEVKVAT